MDYLHRLQKIPTQLRKKPRRSSVTSLPNQQNPNAKVGQHQHHHKQSSQARSYTRPKDLISARTLYAILGVERVCIHTPSEAVQMDATPKFIRAIERAGADDAVRPEIPKRISPGHYNRQNLNRLAFIPGALDLLHALVRRAILPDRSARTCPIASCSKLIDAHHAFTCIDAAHRKALADCHLDVPVTSLNITKVSVPELLGKYANRDEAVMKHVARRVIFFADDVKAERWAKWLLSALKL